MAIAIAADPTENLNGLEIGIFIAKQQKGNKMADLFANIGEVIETIGIISSFVGIFLLINGILLAIIGGIMYG